MSIPHGTYLGGVRTLEDLRQRCHIDESCGCWRWRGGMSHGAPSVFLVLPDSGKRTRMRGRRAAVCLATGKTPGPRLKAYASDDCMHSDCVNPAHARCASQRVACQSYVRKGSTRTAAKLESCMRNLPVRRKLTSAQVHDIRRSSESDEALAARHGVHRTAVWSVRHGRTYRDLPMAGARRSVFDVSVEKL